jgi:hypothetical protein
MHKGVLGRVGGINRHAMARVSTVGGWALDAIFALRADDQHWLARLELVKPLEEVDAAQGDRLRPERQPDPDHRRQRHRRRSANSTPPTASPRAR